MNDEQLLPELDARAASAATALRTYVEGLDLATTPPDRSGRHRGLLAAAALLAIALAAAAVWVAHDERGPKVKTVDHPSPLYLYPDHVPDGVQFRGGGEFSASRGGFPVLPPADVYANAERSKMLVTVALDVGPGNVISPGGHPVTVNGHHGTTSVSGSLQGISFSPRRKQTVTIVGRGFGEDALLQLAERADKRGHQVVFAGGALPDGLGRLGAVELDRLAPSSFFASAGGVGEGHTLNWSSKSGRRSVTIAVEDAGPVDEQVLGLLDRDVRHVSVGGNDAIVTRSAPPSKDARAVAWVEGGHVVRVVTTGFDPQVGIDVAASLRAIGQTEYQRKARAIEPYPGTDVIAEYDGEGARRWKVGVDVAQRRLCIDRGEDQSCDGPVDVGFIEVNVDARPTLVVGTGPPGSKVDVLAGSRSLLAADPVELDDGLVYFVAEVPAGVVSVDVTVDDGQGTDRRTVRTDHGSISSTGSSGATTTSTP
jgi:hypothetical protein